MHELSIAMSIVDMAEEEASRHHGRVTAVHLKLGPLSGVVKEALLGAFEMAREGSALAESALIVEEVAVTAYCPACAAEKKSSRRSRNCSARPAGRRRRRSSTAGSWKSSPSRSSRHDRRAAHHPGPSARPETKRRRRSRSATPLRRGRRLRRQPGVQPRLRQDGVPGKDAHAAEGALSRRRSGRRPGHRQRRPTPGSQRRPRSSRSSPERSAIWKQKWCGPLSTEWTLAELNFLFIENVGNLVCPSSFDLGESLRLVLFSVTEGEDKPLKYPTIFNTSDAAVLTKMDLAAAVEFDAAAAHRSIQAVRPGMRVFKVSAKTGAGMAAWLDFLQSRRRARLAATRQGSAWRSLP